MDTAVIILVCLAIAIALFAYWILVDRVLGRVSASWDEREIEERLRKESAEDLLAETDAKIAELKAHFAAVDEHGGFATGHLISRERRDRPARRLPRGDRQDLESGSPTAGSRSLIVCALPK